MVTNAADPTDGVTKEALLERANAIRDDAARAGRTLLTGDANGRVRRNLLYVAAVVCIVFGLGPLALVPITLLALTDMVVV